MRYLVIVLGVLLLIGVASATPIYVSEYPPAHNGVYVNASNWYSVNYYPWFVTDPSKSLTGTSYGTSWLTDHVGYEFFWIDLGTAKRIENIYYQNYHHTGLNTSRGVKEFLFYGTNASLPAFYTEGDTTGWTALTAAHPHFEQHAAADASDPQNVGVTNNGSYRYYGFKFLDNYGAPEAFIAIRRIELQSVLSWEYSTPGTYYWVCPAGITSVTLSMIGGGGSGSGGHNTAYNYYPGGGGYASVEKSVSRITVVPGTNYTIVVGSKGANASYGSVGNAGSLSSAFGYTSLGGAGGVKLFSGTTGGNGQDGLGTTRYAVNGTEHYGFTAGVSGLGYGASGGGASSDNVDMNTAGGAGADGFVGITPYGYGSGNLPDFEADVTTGIPGTLVHFTDLSNISVTEGLSYNWSFGDGTYSEVAGDVTHVFSYTGSYDVSLTLDSISGDVTEEKVSYINIVNERDTIGLQNVPQPVQFTLVDRYGRVLKNVDVTATMTGISTNGTNWMDTLFGVSSDATPLNTTVLYDITDDGGSVVLPLVPMGRYLLQFTNATQGISESRTVHPQQSFYLYILATSGTTAAPSMDDTVNLSLSTYPPESTNPATVYLIANYTDSGAATTNVSFFVNYPNGTNIYTVYSTVPMNKQYAVTNTAGDGYVWGINATHTSFGNIKKGAGITLKGTGQYGLASNLLKLCDSWECD